MASIQEPNKWTAKKSRTTMSWMIDVMPSTCTHQTQAQDSTGQEKGTLHATCFSTKHCPQNTPI